MSDRRSSIDLLEKLRELEVSDYALLDYLVVNYFDAYIILEALKSACEEFGFEDECKKELGIEDEEDE